MNSTQTRFFVLIALSLLLTFPVLAAERTPLLLPGKQSLYQRVLVIPDGRLYPAPGAVGKPTIPFTAYYVYARKQAEGENWIQVGTDRHGTIQGWLRAKDAIDWNQGLTVAFREPTDHDRALLFRNAEALQEIAGKRDLKRYQALYDAAVKGKTKPDSPVVAIQPPGKLDIRKDFYLVPILAFRDIFVGNEQARMLKVTSVPLQESPMPSPPKSVPEIRTAASPAAALGVALAKKKARKAQPGQPNSALPNLGTGYRAGLVFVIDSTLSMDPYIDRTREAVMKIYDSLGEAGLLGNVNFGLVAFRDSLQSIPQLDYLTRTYVTLDQGRNPGTFLQQVQNLRAAKVSSQDFKEDAYAGIKRAIDNTDWSGHAARYIVLVTDAGPREAGDPLSSTGLSAQQLNKLAREKGIAIFVLHLLTPATKADHARAATLYRELSKFPGIGSLYYGVPTGDIREFGHVLDTVAGQITMQVQVAAAGRPLEKPAEPAAVPESESNPQLAELKSKIAKLGYALQMRYLQRTEGGKIPRVFNAWLLDHDIRNPEKRTLDVLVLLTRDQLSDLHDILQQVLQTAEEGLLSPDNFLNELKSLAATIARDPEKLGETTATTAGTGKSLADLGFMREYIEGLPYTGEVMNLSLADWEAWPAREQIAFIQRLEDKIQYYRALHDHTDLWVSLDGGPIDGDSVFPIPLEMLP